MIFYIQSQEPTKQKNGYDCKIESYKNNIEVMRHADIYNKTKTTTIGIYINAKVDISKIL